MQAIRQLDWRPWFLLFVLTFVFSAGFVDRQSLNLLVQPIKTDLGLSDIRIGLLQGTAFSVAYLTMSPIFGRWVDLAGRRRILMACLIAWSACTALCSLAGGFAALFAMRMLVGAAEAGLTPAAWSMLSDVFDDRRIGRAMSIYHVGPYVGNGVALLLGGAIITHAPGWDLSAVPMLRSMRPWELAFLFTALLGVPAFLLMLLIREPQRRGASAAQGTAAIPLRDTFAVLRKERRFYGCFYGGMAMSNVAIYAFPAWLPALATRQFGVPVARVGLHYGMITLAAGVSGVILAPVAAAALRRMGARDEYLRLALLANLIVAAACVALFFRTSYAGVLAIGGIVSFFCSIATPMSGAALQIVTPNRMRGLATSIYVVSVTLTGLGAAPLLVATVTERILGDDSRVGDSLALVCGAAALGASLAIACGLAAYRRLLSSRQSPEIADIRAKSDA